MPVSTKSSVNFAFTGMLIAVCVIAAGALAEENITACDLEVAHPSDPDRVGPGKPTAEVVTHLAIPACRAAVANAPENPRFHYQLARALVYRADANNGDVTEAVVSITDKVTDQAWQEAVVSVTDLDRSARF